MKFLLHQSRTESSRFLDTLDMDCDGLKKNLLTDLDGSLFGQAGSVVSQADALWGKFSLASALNPHRFCFGRFTATWREG